jgi:hypothetical protein
MIKAGGRLVRYARRLAVQLAEVLVSREIVAEMMDRIRRLRPVLGSRFRGGRLMTALKSWRQTARS